MVARPYSLKCLEIMLWFATIWIKLNWNEFKVIVCVCVGGWFYHVLQYGMWPAVISIVSYSSPYCCIPSLFVISVIFFQWLEAWRAGKLTRLHCKGCEVKIRNFSFHIKCVWLTLMRKREEKISRQVGSSNAAEVNIYTEKVGVCVCHLFKTRF